MYLLASIYRHRYQTFKGASAFNQNLAKWCEADGAIFSSDHPYVTGPPYVDLTFQGTACALDDCGVDGNDECN